MSGEEKQHFIQVDKIDDDEGHLYKVQLLTDHWISPLNDQQSETEKPESTVLVLVVTETDPQSLQPAQSAQADQTDSLFPTEVDESSINDAKYRLSKLVCSFLIFLTKLFN